MSDVVKLKDSNNVEYSIKDTNSGYITANALEPYLTKTAASETYITKTSGLTTAAADETYLTKDDAQEIYCPKETANLLSLALEGVDLRVDDLETITPEAPTTNGQYFFKYDSSDDNHYTWEKSAIPTLPTTNGQYLLKYDSANDNHYTWDQLAITELPPTDSLANGTYTLQCEKTANGTTLSWVSTSSPST